MSRFHPHLFLLEDRLQPSAALVDDLVTGTGSSNPTELTNVGGTLFFLAVDAASNQQLWKSDGTAGGTEAIALPSGLQNLASLTALGSQLFFTAQDATNGDELWVCDGASVSLVKDINPGSGGSAPGDLTAFGGKLYFRATDGASEQLWTSDGTSGGTQPVSNVAVDGFFPNGLIAAGPNLYFAADGGGSASPHGNELWAYNPTDGAREVKDINPGAAGSMTLEEASHHLMTEVNGTELFFVANDGVTGDEVWMSDGTFNGTNRVSDIAPGAAGSEPFDLTGLGNKLFFFADDGTHGFELWETDAAGASLNLFDVDVGPAGSVNPTTEPPMAGFNGSVYFAATDGSSGTELWACDASLARRVADLDIGAGSSNPRNITASGAHLYFTTATALYISDGTAANTTSEPAFVGATPTTISNEASLTDANGKLLFSASDPIAGNELWTVVAGSGPISPFRLPGIFAVGTDAGVLATSASFNANGTLVANSTHSPFGADFAGGARPAVADFNNDGTPDVAIGTGPGIAAEVKIFDGKTGAQIDDLQPFGTTFSGGVFLAVGDVNADGIPELVVTPDTGGGPRVTIYNGANFAILANFFGIDDPNFRGGCRAALGDINGDGKSDLVISAGFGGGPRISVYDGAALAAGQQVHLISDFFMFESALRNGAYVAVGDINGDSKADLIGGGGPGGGPRVLVLDGAGTLAQGAAFALLHPLDNFFAGNTANRGGIRVAVKDFDGDGLADLLTGDGADAGSHVTAYLGANLKTGNPGTALLSFDAYPGFTGGVFVG
jgi:ELWxxDGT repeat protein